MAVVLIGPPAAGKSSVGVELADRLGREFVDADGAAGPFYAEVGWSVDRFQAQIVAQGYEGAHRAWEPALAHAVERLVASHPHAVIALGAGHTHVTASVFASRVKQSLATERVVLLRPAPDLDTTLRVLRQRCLDVKGHDWVRDGVDFLRRWCTDGCDERLATETAYTVGERPADTAARLAGPGWHRPDTG